MTFVSIGSRPCENSLGRRLGSRGRISRPLSFYFWGIDLLVITVAAGGFL